MNIIYSSQYKDIIRPAIFLAGCSPRDDQILTWRKEVINILGRTGFTGSIISPQPELNQWSDYNSVVEWEDEYLKIADLIVFWIPRSMKNQIYGLTSNVEFGMYLNSGKILYGRPPDSEHNCYLDYWYKRVYNLKPVDNLEDLVQESLNFLSQIKNLSNPK